MRKPRIFIIAAVILLAGLAVGVMAHFYYGKIVVADPYDARAVIYIEPDNNATRAAANYLALGISRELGFEPLITTTKEDGEQYISILCGTEIGTEPESGETGLNYTLTIDGTGFSVTVPAQEQCFWAVKAVTDRWLQEDCGLKNGRLSISRYMISRRLSALTADDAGEIRILSQNLRNRDDKGGNSIAERAERFFQLLSQYQPDIIGTQECPIGWLQLLQDRLSEEYAFFGCSREGPGETDGDWNAIVYRKDRFTLLDGDTFWLSNTPDEPSSLLNYDGSPRICTWAVLHDDVTGKDFLFGNTHLHHIGEELGRKIRSRQAEILMQRLRKGNKLEKYPGFLTGDFNGTPGEPFYPLITDSYSDSRALAITDRSEVDYTYQAYGNAKVLCDYCFCSPGTVAVLEYNILDDQYDGYVSDHYGVLVTAVLN